VNLLIKKVKRVGHGFRNFANYRLRLLLHCGVVWQTHQEVEPGLGEAAAASPSTGADGRPIAALCFSPGFSCGLRTTSTTTLGR
jgi:hypothetical protein